MSTPVLHRATFETSRAAEYFTIKELQAQTGQELGMFAMVALKEAGDNGIDAAEAAGVAPCIIIELAVSYGDDSIWLAVQDNGGGIPPETVRRVLNFNTRTSDKSAYRSPMRGAQGNALKTILGMPYALGGQEPVVIEAQGIRHTIAAGINPAGDLVVQHDETPVPPGVGTRITLALPFEQQSRFEPNTLARGFALFNPHATIKIRVVDAASLGANAAATDSAYFYDECHEPTVVYPGAWRKWLPTDPTSAWWYTPEALTRLLFAQCGEDRRTGKDMTVRAFVGSFRGLSGTAKIKAVCDQFPTVERLSDIERTPNVVPALLRAMQEHSRPAAPSVLGAIGKEHLRARFDDWYGIVADRFWYSAQEGTAGGIPFVVECAAAETRQPGASFYGINFSPTYDDPLATVPLTVPSFGSRRYGLKGLLKAAHALPDDVGDGDSTHTATVVHLVCPALDFLDRAKTRLSVSDEFAEPIARVVWGACKTLYKDGERRRKDAARAARVQQAWETQSSATCTLKEAVFAVLQASVDHVTGGKVGDPLQVRSLYYVVRKRIQAFTSKDLDFNYFSQDLLVQYQEAHGAIPGLEYDPRGVLYEPHTGRRVLLGTREVASYQFPAWLYNKILYIEKKGLGGVLLVAGLGERYDMAIIAAEGFATEAARKLCQRADRDQCYEIYVVHDADPAGYNIARTLAEETRRVKDNRVTVIDLGLRYDEALAMGLETETFTRKKALPSGLVLTESERRAFTGRQTGPNSWECTRVELNAMTNPQLLAFVERRLAEVGAVGKVIPPPDALARLSAEHYGERAAAVVAERLWCLYGGDRLTDGVTRLLRDALPPDVIERAIRDGFAADAAQPWRAPMERAVKQNMESQAATIDALARNAEPVPAIEQPDCASQGEPDGRALGALARGADGNAPRPRQ